MKNIFCAVILAAFAAALAAAPACYAADAAFREVAKGSFTGVHTESVTVLDTRENLLAAVSDLCLPKLDAADSVDFSKEFLVLIVASASPNPGYRIVPETVEFKDGEANVKYRTERGPDGVMYAQVISYPWLLVALER